MSKTIDDGGAAFPYSHPYVRFGMTIRDYFAAAMLPGLLHPGWDANAVNNPDEVASMAYKLADAMLEKRLERTDE